MFQTHRHSVDVSVRESVFTFDIEMPSIDSIIDVIRGSISQAFDLTVEVLSQAIPEIFPIRTGYLISYILSTMRMQDGLIQLQYPPNRPFIIQNINYLSLLQEMILYCINALVLEFNKTNPKLILIPQARLDSTTYITPKTISTYNTKLDFLAVLSQNNQEGNISLMLNIVTDPTISLEKTEGEVISVVYSDIVRDKRRSRTYTGITKSRTIPAGDPLNAGLFTYRVSHNKGQYFDLISSKTLYGQQLFSFLGGFQK